MIVVKDLQIKIPREEVLRLLKHKEGATIVDQKTSDMVNQMIEEGKKLSEAKAVYSDFNVKNVRDHAVELENSMVELTGKSTSHRLWNAKKVTLFLVTIGPNIGKKIADLTKQGSMAMAAVLDAVGSAAVESLAGQINDLTDNRAKEAGFKTTNRFSPGYGDWELREQKGILQQLNASQLGVTLTNGSLMQPEKSVTAVIGWVQAE